MIKSVIIDSREPTWIQHLTFGGIPVAVGALDAGDVWAATDDGAILVIERKEANDLLGSIGDGRLFSQCAKMREVSDWCYIIIIGHLTNSNGKAKTGDRVSGWNWNSVQGALLTVQELGVQVVYSDDFEQAIIMLANRSREDVTIKPPRAPSLLSDGEVMLTSLPGIGTEKLNAVLEHCGTPAWALAYLSDRDKDITDARGIGLITRLKCRQALRLKENERLVVEVIEKENTNGRE